MSSADRRPPSHRLPESTLAAGLDLAVGTFRIGLPDETWWWSSETYAIHGFAPREVVPTTALVLAHKHPDDRERVREVITRTLARGEPFASVHRIVTATGSERIVAVSGQGMPDHDGAVRLVVGQIADVTTLVEARGQEAASRSIAASAHHRAEIENAKGAVAMAYGTDPETAFAFLRSASNASNRPLRDVAADIVARIPSLRHDVGALTDLVEGYGR